MVKFTNWGLIIDEDDDGTIRDLKLFFDYEPNPSDNPKCPECGKPMKPILIYSAIEHKDVEFYIHKRHNRKCPVDLVQLNDKGEISLVFYREYEEYSL